MASPAISLIVPLYCVEDYIKDCIDSLKAQTFCDFEVICINDGSPDNSCKIAQECAGDDERFVFVEQENAGLSAARNTGIDHAKGTYLMFLDSDDMLIPEALELLEGTARAYDLDYLDFTAHTFYEDEFMRLNNNEDAFEQRSSILGTFTGPDLFVRYQSMDEYFCPSCFHFFKRSLLEKKRLRFRTGMIHEDELFSPLLIARAKRAQYLNIPLYLRRMRADSIMTSTRGIKNVHGMMIASHELEKWMREYAYAHMQEEHYDEAFLGAFAQRIAFLRSLMVEDAARINIQALEQFKKELPLSLKLDFEMHIKGGFMIREQTNTRIGQIYLYAKEILLGKV